MLTRRCFLLFVSLFEQIEIFVDAPRFFPTLPTNAERVAYTQQQVILKSLAVDVTTPTPLRLDFEGATESTFNIKLRHRFVAAVLTRFHRRSQFPGHRPTTAGWKLDFGVRPTL